MNLFKSCALALVLALTFSACASHGPQPGTLEFIRSNQQHELARACHRELRGAPWKETYYNVGGDVFVDERDYCEITAWRAVRGMSFHR